MDKPKVVEFSGFPITDPFELKVKGDEGEMLKLKTYEYPAVGETKALIFLMSDNEFSANYFAYLFKDFANRGFRVFSFELRGFNGSEGPKEIVDNNAIGDSWAFIDEALKYSKGDNLPKFVMGYCMSALIATILCEQEPNFFKGCI
jgi:alpha-beta hydrolase superfamily lysophospholipase